MQVERLAIPDILVLTPRRFADPRGWFAETWHAPRYRAVGIDVEFVQDNQSLSRPRFTVRGLHCQVAPSAMGKLVRVLRGAVLDVAVDVRDGSATYGQHVTAMLSAENGAQLWVPAGFLHGFCTLEPDTEVFYKCTGLYDPAAERGVRWNDPALGIAWPVLAEEAVVSDKDRLLPGIDAARGWFSA